MVLLLVLLKMILHAFSEEMHPLSEKEHAFFRQGAPFFSKTTYFTR